jgi:hypothetical protein
MHRAGGGRRFEAAIALVAAMCLLGSASAASAKTFLKGTADPHLAASDASVRAFWQDQGVAAGSNIVRINVPWRAITTGKPVDPSNPADPAYGFADIDRGVADATARGQRVMLTVYSTPDFAIGPNESAEAKHGTWKPDTKALGQFAEAVATRYSGSFQGLPAVGYIEAWNEPNLSDYLSPQYTKKSTFAGDYYRGMVNAVSAGVRRSGSGAKVVAGATAPYGDPVGGERSRPLRFMRDFLCLDGDLKPRPKCKDRANFDILSHHPITLSGGPNRSAIHPDDLAMPDVKHLERTLRRAEKKTTVKGGKHPLWATEFWWETNPPDPQQGVPVKKHARWIQESLHSLWKQGADAAFWFLLVDQPLGSDGSSDQQSGLFFEDRSRKPAFTAFRFPFVAERTSKRKAEVWTIPPTSGTLEVQEERGGQFITVKRVQVEAFQPKKIGTDAKGKTRLRGNLAGESSLTDTVG